MAKKRAKFFETRIFGFVIAAVVAIVIALTNNAGLFVPLELKTLDTHFRLKNSNRGKTIQEGSVYSEKSQKVSDDIMIVGIDFSSLSKYGKWPFPRWRHADLINAFARIKDQTKRESALFLDVFFNEADSNTSDDQVLLNSMKDSGRVYLETVLSSEADTSAFADEMHERERTLYGRFGTATNIKGDWKNMLDYLGSEPPLAEYTKAISGYGQANYSADKDQVYRRQPMIAKASLLLEELKFDDLKPGIIADESRFERLAWLDKNGAFHNIDMPLTEKSIKALQRALEKDAPAKVEDTNGDGTPDTQYFLIRHYQDYFIPSITLSLALNYFGKTFSDLDIIIGDRISYPFSKQIRSRSRRTNSL